MVMETSDTRLTATDLTDRGFKITTIANRSIATKRRADGKAIQIAIQPDGQVWPKALLITAANQVERVLTVDVIN
jgi:hypothetical protein